MTDWNLIHELAERTEQDIHTVSSMFAEFIEYYNTIKDTDNRPAFVIFEMYLFYWLDGKDYRQRKG